ncbi:WD40/YVTN/BNR-like repeat-containing protein [Nannocystaceae bacterium ST9]
MTVLDHLHALALVATALASLPGCEPDPAPTHWSIALEVDDSVGAFLAAWGRERGEVYAVGGNPDRGALWRFDGAAWTGEELPADMPLVNWLIGFETEAGTVLWLAGNQGQLAHRGPTGEWTRMALANEGALWGIWGASEDDVWTVGGDIPGDAPQLAHWDGASWTASELPATDREFDALLKVWGSASDRVWAVGQNGVILHYRGGEWTQQLAGVSADLISLWGTGEDEIVAVGGRSNGVIARYDGSTWTSQTIGELPGLNGVWIDAEGRAFAVGIDGVVIEIAPGGFEWTELDRHARPDTLHGALGLADGSRFGVGGSLLFSPPWTGVIVQYLP